MHNRRHHLRIFLGLLLTLSQSLWLPVPKLLPPAQLNREDIFSPIIPVTKIHGNLTLQLENSLRVPTPSYLKVLSKGFLSVTSFSLLRKGSIMEFNLRNLKEPRVLDGDYQWPNELNIFHDKWGHPILLVSDGFLLPGQNNGGLYIIRDPYMKKLGSKEGPRRRRHKPIRITSMKPGWFYHRAVHVTLPCGREGILTARANKPFFGKGRGELVWLNIPDDLNEVFDRQERRDNNHRDGTHRGTGADRGILSDAVTGININTDSNAISGSSYASSSSSSSSGSAVSNINNDDAADNVFKDLGKVVSRSSSSGSHSKPWTETILAEGPDVMFEVLDLDPNDDTLEIISAHFFGSQLSIISLRGIDKPPYVEVVESKTIDTIGRPYGLCLANLDSVSSEVDVIDELASSDASQLNRGATTVSTSGSSSSNSRANSAGTAVDIDISTTRNTISEFSTIPSMDRKSTRDKASLLSKGESKTLLSSPTRLSSSTRFSKPKPPLATTLLKMTSTSTVVADADLNNIESSIDHMIDPAKAIAGHTALIDPDVADLDPSSSRRDVISPTHVLVTTHTCTYDIPSTFWMAMSALGGILPGITSGAALAFRNDYTVRPGAQPGLNHDEGGCLYAYEIPRAKTRSQRVIEGTKNTGTGMNSASSTVVTEQQSATRDAEAKSTESLSASSSHPPNAISQEWKRHTLFSGFRVSAWGGIISPGAPGFPYVFRMPNKPNSPPHILLAGDCTGSAYLFSPTAEMKSSSQQEEGNILDVSGGVGSDSNSDDNSDNNSNIDGAVVGATCSSTSAVTNETTPSYEMAFEIQCGGTVGSLAVATVPDNSGDVEIFVPSYELNKVHVFRLSDRSQD